MSSVSRRFHEKFSGSVALTRAYQHVTSSHGFTPTSFVELFRSEHSRAMARRVRLLKDAGEGSA